MTYLPTPIKTPYGPVPYRGTSRHALALRRGRALVRKRGAYLAPLGGAQAWGTWIYLESWLTNPGQAEILAYGGVAAIAGAATAAAIKHGARNPSALYGGTLVAGVMGWSAWQVTAPSFPGAAIGVVGAIGACVPYWKWLASHRLDRDKLASKLAPEPLMPLAPDDVVGALEQLGKPGAHLDQMLRHPDGSWTAIVSLPVGVSPRDVAAEALSARLAAALRLPPGWTLDVEDGGATHHLVVTARPPRMQIAMPNSHPLVAQHGEWDPWQPLLAAVDAETGERVHLHLMNRAGILLAGLQRMGKSVLLSVIAAHLAMSRARLILCDAKLVELSLWAPLCTAEGDFIGRDPEAFLAKLLWLQEEIDRRYAKLVKEGRVAAAPGDGWEPIALVIDELAAYIDIPDRKLRAKIVSVLRDIISRGPACAVPIIAATQKPDDKVIPSQIRDVFGQRVAFATTTWQMTDAILGTGYSVKGALAHEIGETEKGTAYLLEEGRRAVKVQTFPFDMDARRTVIAAALELWPDRPGANVPLPGEHDVPDYEPDPTPGGGRHLRIVPTFPDGSRIPDHRVPLWQAMDKAGPDGFTINDLVALGMPGYQARTSVDGPLQQWRRSGWLVELGKRDRAQLFALTTYVKAA